MIYKWVGRPAFSCLGRGLVEIVLLPFQAVLVSAARDRVSSDLGGNNLPVFEIPISWFPDLAFHSMPKPSPMKGSMGLILSSDAGGYFLPLILSISRKYMKLNPLVCVVEIIFLLLLSELHSHFGSLSG